MTREEAIKRVQAMLTYMETLDANEEEQKDIEAYRMVIAALKTEPCEDCVSREAVIALAKEECETAIIPYKRFVKGVNALPLVIPQQRWIPVSERLPEKYGEYLITWTTSQSKRPFIGISEGEVTGEYDHEHNRFKFEWLLEDYIKAYPNAEVTAWMPLPEPYREVD